MCDAKTLFEAIESGKAVDEKTIISVLSQRNTGQLRSIWDSYKQLYGSEFSSKQNVANLERIFGLRSVASETLKSSSLRN
ncbi:Annexin repeat [Parasponia andersonii]|uniref:Annexin repeat n=1 Tax=Parasponia andersonii TaxID=3476 RepID=A0A2P5CS70_PARAD|nr:Annexin repeat [Parasponia andersonii]